MVLIIPNCYLVAIKAVSGGQDVVNVIGIHAPNSNSASVANAVDQAWRVALGPLSKLPNTYQMVEVKAMDLSSANGQVFSVPASAVGQLSGALATNGSCALITYGSGSRAKSTKGRMYFGPLREVEINNDGRTLANAGQFTSALTVFRDNLAAGAKEYVVLSRKNSSHSPVSVIQTQSVIATQRRRIR